MDNDNNDNNDNDNDTYTPQMIISKRRAARAVNQAMQMMLSMMFGGQQQVQHSPHAEPIWEIFQLTQEQQQTEEGGAAPENQGESSANLEEQQGPTVDWSGPKSRTSARRERRKRLDVYHKTMQKGKFWEIQEANKKKYGTWNLCCCCCIKDFFQPNNSSVY